MQWILVHGFTCLTGMDAEMMVKTISNIDVDLVIEFGEYIVSAIDQMNEIRIISIAGTDLKSPKR